MKPQQINEAVASELGLKNYGVYCGICREVVPSAAIHDGVHKRCGCAVREDVPDYSADLNACVEMRRALKLEEIGPFVDCLRRITTGSVLSNACFPLIDATAAQQCEAFLSVRGKWVDS